MDSLGTCEEAAEVPRVFPNWQMSVVLHCEWAWHTFNMMVDNRGTYITIAAMIRNLDESMKLLGKVLSVAYYKTDFLYVFLAAVW